MTQRPGGSYLATVAAQRLKLANARRALSLSSESGAPQSPTRTNPNPPPPPQAPADVQQRDPSEVKAAMLSHAQDFLNQAGAQAQNTTPLPNATPQVTSEDTRPGTSDALLPRIDQLGATSRSTATQFYRLAGREATPRELAIFRARLSLESQLNRPPTEGELRAYISRSDSIGQMFSPAVP